MELKTEVCIIAHPLFNNKKAFSVVLGLSVVCSLCGQDLVVLYY